jgi:5'-methylthioadenosine phosphorylase
MVTDYDVWQEKPVQAQEVIKRMKENLEKIKNLLKLAIPKIEDKRNCFCQEALKYAKI